jgi:hypothetical protein
MDQPCLAKTQTIPRRRFKQTTAASGLVLVSLWCLSLYRFQISSAGYLNRKSDLITAADDHTTGSTTDTNSFSLTAATTLDDPFRYYQQRKRINSTVIRDVLQLCDPQSACRKHALHIPSGSLTQLASVLRHGGRNGPNRLVIGIVGDSVGIGCCATPRGGFRSGLKSYLISTFSQFSWHRRVEMRDYARSASSPTFNLYYNQVRGDEDIIIFETVFSGHSDSVLTLARGLKQEGYAVILLHWKPWPSMLAGFDIDGILRVADELALPYVHPTENLEAYAKCLPPESTVDLMELSNKSLAFDLPMSLYAESVHPNIRGHLLLACLLGGLFEEAVSLPATGNPHQGSSYSSERTTSAALSNNSTGVTKLAYSRPTCYDRLNCNTTTSSSKCLQVLASDGFVLRELVKVDETKTWWEGTVPGQWIEFLVGQPSTSLAVFVNLRTTNGKVSVKIDSVDVGVVDAYREPLHWLPDERGLRAEIVFAQNLALQPHTVRFTILNESNAEHGEHKFDFVAVAGGIGAFP